MSNAARLLRDGQESREGARLAAAVLRDGSLGTVDQWTPLDEVMQLDPPEPGDEDEEIVLTRAELQERLRKAKVSGLLAFLRYVWFGAPNLWEALKRLLAITRKTRADMIKGMTATQVAWMLGETRAATSAREIRVVEQYLRDWGVLGFQGTGGAKSMEARAKYAEAQKGNKNRANGRKHRGG